MNFLTPTHMMIENLFRLKLTRGELHMTIEKLKINI